jgi:hypothetical protein
MGLHPIHEGSVFSPSFRPKHMQLNDPRKAGRARGIFLGSVSKPNGNDGEPSRQAGFVAIEKLIRA